MAGIPQIRTPAGVVVGETIEGTVAVSLQRSQLPEADSNGAVTVDVSVIAETQGLRGETFHEIARFTKSVCIFRLYGLGGGQEKRACKPMPFFVLLFYLRFSFAWKA